MNGRGEGRAQTREAGMPGRACCWQGARHEGLAESWHSSLLAKLHKLSRLIWQKLIFFFKVRRLDQQKEEDPMEGGRGRAPGCHSEWRPAAGWSPGGLLLETAATLTRCLKTSCSIVVFTGPGLCLPRPGRRTRRPRTTEGGFLPAPGEGQRALRLGLQPNDKTSGDILT